MIMVATYHYQRLVFTLLFTFLCFLAVFSHAASSRVKLKQGELIRDKQRETLVSEELEFVMGFFSLENSTSRYVGIWYYNIPGPAVIWVANRDKPIKDAGGAITIASDGNLVVLDGEMNQVWSSNVSVPSNRKNSSEALLRDDGNLVVSSHGEELWQSYENPTDTYVPGMKVPVGASSAGKGFTFRSWKSATDPSPGNYSMGADPEGLPQIVVWEGENLEKRRWRSGYWDGRIFTGVEMTGSLLYGFTLNRDGEGGGYFVYNQQNSTKVRFQIGYDGFEKEFSWNEGEKDWSEKQRGPANECEVYDKCGSFAACGLSDSGLAVCSCLQGFELKEKENLFGGCKRITKLKAERNASSGDEMSDGEDGFLVRRCMKLPDFAHVVGTEDCRSNCLKNDSCTAYAEVLGIGCMVWYGEVLDVQEFDNVGNTLHIRLAHSDLGKVKCPFILVFMDKFFQL